MVFIGERNCGKSSIINELLEQTYLPVHENPCTARIVRIKHADEMNARLIKADGEVVQSTEDIKDRRRLEEFIVVSDKERDNSEALDATVEVGLNHDLLKSGIELIDSPGKNESDVLDRVLDDFLEKGTVPLFVYVIDGKMRLRPSGDPLATSMYAISLQPLMSLLQNRSTAKQCWFADDVTGAGSLEEVKQWWDELREADPTLGYYPNSKKCWPVVKPEKEGRTKEMFGGTGLNITTEGRKHRGTQTPRLSVLS